MRKRIFYPLFALLVACGGPDFISTFEGQIRFKYDCDPARWESFDDGQTVAISKTKEGVQATFAGTLITDEGMCPELQGTTDGNTLTVKPADCPPYTMRDSVQRLTLDGGTMTLDEDTLTLDMKATRYVDEEEHWGYTCPVVVVGSLVRQVTE